MGRITSAGLLFLATLLAGCQTQGLARQASGSSSAASPLAKGIRLSAPALALAIETQAATRLVRRAPSLGAVEPSCWASRSDQGDLGRALAAPRGGRPGIGGSRVSASVAFIAPDTANAGLFYAVNDRWTVGLVGQHLRQERSVAIDGQLIDPDDLNSFIDDISVTEKTTSIAFGPFVQLRLSEERGFMPALSIAAYALEWGTVTEASTSYSRPSLMVVRDGDAASSGESSDAYRSLYVSASKRLPLAGNMPLVCGARLYGGAGVGVRTGKRYTVAQTGQGDPRIRVLREDLTRTSFVGWIGTEVELPRSFSLYGEVFTGDECVAGYAAGVRWKSPLGITFTLGFTNCIEAIPQRTLDLVYLPGGVGGQPSLVSSGGGVDGGGLGYLGSTDEDDAAARRRRRR